MHPLLLCPLQSFGHGYLKRVRCDTRNPSKSNLWSKYKELRNDVKYLTIQSYCAYVNDLALNCSSNPKRFWSFVSSQRRKSTVTSFTTNLGSVSDAARIAQGFNDIFPRELHQGHR